MMDKEKEIIENTEEAKDKYGHMWGSGTLHLSDADMQALYNGKCIATNDGEYTTFIVLED